MATPCHKQRAGLLRRFSRLLQRPWVTLLILVVALVDLFTLKPGSVFSRWSDPVGSRVANMVGSLLEPMSLPGGSHDLGRAPEAKLGWTADEDDVRPIAWDDRYSATYAASARYAVLRSGTWGLTHEVREFGWDVTETILDASVDVPASVRERIDELFYARVWESGDARWIERFDAARAAGSTTWRTEHPLWTGYLRNLASMVNAGLLLISLGWVLRTRRVRSRWRKLARGTCPDCGYTLGPSRQADPCPECGRAHPPRDASAASGHAWLADRLAARAGRALRRPLVSALLLVLLLHDLFLLPKGQSDANGSWVMNRLPLPALRLDAGDGNVVDTFAVGVIPHAEGNAYTLDPNGPPPSFITIERHAWSYGFWAPVRFHTSVFVDWNENLYPSDAKQRYEALSTFLDVQGWPFWAAAVRDRHTQGLLRSGHVHNALALTALLTLAISLGWIPDAVANRMGQRSERRGRCAYCLAELDAAATTCRVCGKPRATTPADWSRSA